MGEFQAVAGEGSRSGVVSGPTGREGDGRHLVRLTGSPMDEEITSARGDGGGEEGTGEEIVGGRVFFKRARQKEDHE